MTVTMHSRDAVLSRRVGDAIDKVASGDMTHATVTPPVLGTPAAVAAPAAAVATWKLAAGAVGGAATVVGAYFAGRAVGSW